MPKLKSHRGAKKRVRRTGGGHVAFKRRCRNHLLMQKSVRQKRLNRTVLADAVNRKSLEALVPYL